MTLLALVHAVVGGSAAGSNPAKRVAASTRECAMSMVKNEMEEAHRHCLEAIHQVEAFEVWGLEAGHAFGQIAVLYMAQDRPVQAVGACKKAISFWRDIPPDSHGSEQAGSGIAICLRLMTDAKRKRRTAENA